MSDAGNGGNNESIGNNRTKRNIVIGVIIAVIIITILIITGVLAVPWRGRGNKGGEDNPFKPSRVRGERAQKNTGELKNKDELASNEGDSTGTEAPASSSGAKGPSSNLYG